MTEAEILHQALEAQAAHGTEARVEVFIPRLPLRADVKNLRIRPSQGPWGRIVALTADGSIVSFEAVKLILFLSPDRNVRRRRVDRAVERVQIHPSVPPSVIEQLNAFCSESQMTVGKVVELALCNFLQQRA
jgi:hypothetical protein